MMYQGTLGQPQWIACSVRRSYSWLESSEQCTEMMEGNVKTLKFDLIKLMPSSIFSISLVKIPTISPNQIVKKYP